MWNTGNPLGSDDPKDLQDNARNVDRAINSKSASEWTDRFGATRKTWSGIEKAAQIAITEAVLEATEEAMNFSNEAQRARDDARAIADASAPVVLADNYDDAIRRLSLGEASEDEVVEVLVDETRSSNRTRYRVIAGSLAFVTTMRPTHVLWRAGTKSQALNLLPEMGDGDEVMVSADETRSGARTIYVRSGSSLILEESRWYDTREFAPRNNHLWAGFFRVWQQGGALNVSSTERIYISDGATYARHGFVEGVTAYHVRNPAVPRSHGVRIARKLENASPVPANITAALTQEETTPLLGRTVCLQVDIAPRPSWGGGACTLKLQCSKEPEQPIIKDDATYVSGHELIAQISGTGQLEVVAQIPIDAVQVSAVIEIPFDGIAALDDGVDVFNWWLTTSNSRVEEVLEPSFADLYELAKTRYQTSYPYGAPRGTLTEQGSVSAIAATAAVQWGLSSSVRFSPPLAFTPQFLFQSTLSGTESRMTDTVTQTTVNGLAYNLSDAGVTVTNNATVVDGRRYLFHWTAVAKV